MSDLGHIQLQQGASVLLWGVLGILLAFVPAFLLLPQLPRPNGFRCALLSGLWACFVGLPVTYYWSKALHDRLHNLREQLHSANVLLDDEKKQYPGRLRWMPAWLGLFERAFYSILIGLDVAGGAAFVGVWIALKLAGGWQVRSKGTMYGHAIFVAGLLGNSMSVMFGLVAGLVIRAFTRH